MERNRTRSRCFLFCLGLLFLFGCGLPGELKKEAQKKTGQIATARTLLSQQKTDYDALQKTEGFTFFEPYAERENWGSRFQHADEMLKQAEKEITDGRVAFFLKENKKDKAGRLQIELATIDRMIRTALQKAKEPEQRMAELKNIRDTAPQRVTQAETSLETIHALLNDLEQTFVPQAQKDYANRADDIATRYAPLKQIGHTADTALATAREQLKLHENAAGADYAILGATTDQITRDLEAIKKQNSEYRATINELYQSYTKILDDMRIDYYVTVGRVSWDENSDFWREHNYVYPASHVSREVYEFFTALNPNTVPATYTSSWGGQYKSNVQKDYWAALKIVPTQQWPTRSDNTAEFWIEETFPKAFHKYIMIQNEERKETDWIEVDEEDYNDYYDFLGMEIVSKPYGYFEDEKIKEASPPGMAFVGDSRYGEWRNDRTTGRSFWYYYGIYSFLNRGLGHRYYRGDWDTWRGRYRNREPYYGGTGTTGSTYGTYGTQVRTDSRYRNSEFAKKGGLKTQTPSVRGAGPARRGGGPGSAGK